MGGSSRATTGSLRGTRWFPSALGMTRGVQGWTSHLLEFIQVSALTFHLLIHQNHEAGSEPSPWQSLEVFHAAPTAALADASQGECHKCQSTAGRDKGPHSTRGQLRAWTHAVLGWESSKSTDACSRFRCSPVLIKVGIIITQMLGFGSGTFYLCPLEEEVVSLGKQVSASVSWGQTLTLGEGPEKKTGSAAGFAAYKPAEHTQPGF